MLPTFPTPDAGPAGPENALRREQPVHPHLRILLFRQGIYAIIKFNSIKGTFSNQYKQLKFSDVEIKSDGGDIVAPQFELIDGKLRMGNLYYVAPGGNRARIHFFS